VGEAGFAAQPTIEHGKSPDTFLISARSATFASLRSFLPTAGNSARDLLTQTALRAVFPLTPPAPYSPGQSPGGEGEPSGLEVFRRVGEAGFAAQPTIDG